MFNPIQIKHECIGAEDVNSGGRIIDSDNSKLPIYVNEDINYKYNQFPQLWNHPELPNEVQSKNETYGQQNVFQTEEKGPLIYVKDFVQTGILFQTNQNESINQNQVNQQFHLDTSQNIEQSQDSQNMQQLNSTSDVETNSKSTSLIKFNHLGRSPENPLKPNVGKKLKCQCEICFKEFGHKSNLFIHMRTHNGERPYKCSQCDKCFSHSGNLAIHMRTHSGERPYGCQICGKMFSHSGNLSTHLRTHSGVKPYKCAICGKEFRHSGNLSIHERIHSGIKPFQCKVCGKDFYHSGNLTTHMKKHTANNATINQCENNESRAIFTTMDLNNTEATNSYSNLSLSPINEIKLMANSNNIVPIKNENNNETMTSATETLTPTSS